MPAALPLATPAAPATKINSPTSRSTNPPRNQSASAPKISLRLACQRRRRPLCLLGYLLAVRSYSRGFLLASLTLPAFSSRSRQLAMAPGERLIPRPTTPEVAGSFFRFRFM
jgi:hypothetical protein